MVSSSEKIETTNVAGLGSNSFRDATVILPVINETSALEQAVEIVLNDCGEDICEFIAIVCHKTSAESLTICTAFRNRLGDRFKILKQKLPFLGGAIRDGFDAAKGSHVLVMFSDGESDPVTVKELIVHAKANPEVIVSASRWLEGGRFHGYGPIKIYYNLAAQKFFIWLYQSQLTDLTFGFRIYPIEVVRSIVWTEVKHSFVFESILKPIRLKLPIAEVPTIWRARHEGESQLVLMAYLRYLWVGFKYRFYPLRKMLRKGSSLGLHVGHG